MKFEWYMITDIILFGSILIGGVLGVFAIIYIPKFYKLLHKSKSQTSSKDVYCKNGYVKMRYFCPECGTEVSNRDRECSACGIKINWR